METKKWYQSKAMWAGIVGILVVVYNAISGALVSGCELDPVTICIHLPAIPEWVLGILAGLGLYGRKIASTKIE